MNSLDIKSKIWSRSLRFYRITGLKNFNKFSPLPKELVLWYRCFPDNFTKIFTVSIFQSGYFVNMMPADLTGALNIKQPLMRTTLYFFRKYMGTRKKSLSGIYFFANFQSNCSFKYLIVIFLSTLSKLKTTLRFSRHFCFVFTLVLYIYFFQMPLASFWCL